MIQRYGGAAAVALLISFGLFTIMQSLVARGTGGLAEKRERTVFDFVRLCLLYTSPSPRDQRGSRMPSSA